MKQRAELIGPLKEVTVEIPRNSSILPKEIWFKIFNLLTIRELGRLASVLKYFEAIVNAYELQQYCKVAELRNNRFRAPEAKELLTAEKLSSGWPWSARKLRLLLQYAAGNNSSTVIHFVDEIVANFFDTNTNGFLNNPYLRNLLVCGAIKAKSSLLDFLTSKQWSSFPLHTQVGFVILDGPPTDLESIVEPSSAFLYEYLYKNLSEKQTDANRKQVVAVCVQIVRKFIGQSSLKPLLFHALSDNAFVVCFYLQPETTIKFLLEAKKMSLNFEKIKWFSSLSPAMQEWLAQGHLESSIIEFFLGIQPTQFDTNLPHTDQDLLVGQLERLDKKLHKLYLKALLKIYQDKIKRRRALNSDPDKLKVLCDEVIKYQLDLRQVSEGEELLAILISFNFLPEKLAFLKAFFIAKIKRDQWGRCLPEDSTFNYNKVCELFLKLSDETAGFIINDRDGYDLFQSNLRKELLRLSFGGLYHFLTILPCINPQIMSFCQQSLITMENLGSLKPDTIAELSVMLTFCESFVITLDLMTRLISFCLQHKKLISYQDFFVAHNINEPLEEQLVFMLASDPGYFVKSAPCGRLIKKIGLANFNAWPVIREHSQTIILTLEQAEQVDPAYCESLIELIHTAIQQGSLQDLSFSVRNNSCLREKRLSLFFNDKHDAKKRRKRDNRSDEGTETEPDRAKQYDFLRLRTVAG